MLPIGTLNVVDFDPTVPGTEIADERRKIVIASASDPDAN